MTSCKTLGLSFCSPDLKFYEDRLNTFDTWPLQIVPNKYQLASAGFTYTGKSDIVECFSCELRLDRWKKEDDPVKEHTKLSPNCYFIKMIGHSNYEAIQGLDVCSKNGGFFSPWSTSSQS